MRFTFALIALLSASSLIAESLDVADSSASSEVEMRVYDERIEHIDVTIRMVPVSSPKFKSDDKGASNKKVKPFWMSETEVTWDSFEVWQFDLTEQHRIHKKTSLNKRDIAASGIEKPPAPPIPLDFGMGHRNYPAVSMSTKSAETFCRWLSARTGRLYRLPTDAEWEHACRAGSRGGYAFGDDPRELDRYAWFAGNARGKYQKVRKKLPNAFGLYDLHGNVAEIVVNTADPMSTKRSYVVRGGSYKDRADKLKISSSVQIDPAWKKREELGDSWAKEMSVWYSPSADHVGFRIVRTLEKPDLKESPAERHATTMELRYESAYGFFDVNGDGIINQDEHLRGMDRIHYRREEIRAGRPLLGLDAVDGNGKGVVVTKAFERLPASKSGIKTGDLITKIDGKKVASLDEYRAAVRRTKGQAVVDLLRGGDLKQVVVSISHPRK